MEQTPLHLCTDGAAARALLDQGAEPDAADAQGRTPLHIAAEAGRVDVGDACVAFGGVRLLEIADGDHWLPEATAEYYGKRDFVRFCQLLEAEASVCESWSRTFGQISAAFAPICIRNRLSSTV